MRFNELLTESATDRVYHYTSLHNAYKILAQQQFRLTPAGGTSSDMEHQQGRAFYLSLARSPSADYALSSAYYTGVIFNLNGQWLTQRFRVRPVDYWEQAWNRERQATRDGGGHSTRTSEQEDRLMTNQPVLPLPNPASALISEVHILVTPTERDFQDRQAGVLRGLIFEAKRSGIRVFVYDTLAAWKVQDRRKNILTKEFIASLTGVRPKAYVSSYSMRDSFKKWREVYYKNDYAQLSKDAQREVDNMLNYSDRGRMLDADIHNEKKSDSTGLTKLLAIFRQIGVQSGSQFVAAMTEKWKKLV